MWEEVNNYSINKKVAPTQGRMDADHYTKLCKMCENMNRPPGNFDVPVKKIIKTMKMATSILKWNTPAFA